VTTMALNGSSSGSSKGFFGSFNDVWVIDGVRTPMVDYCGEFSAVSATDLGIKVGREVLKRSGVPASDIGSARRWAPRTSCGKRWSTPRRTST